MAGVLNSRHARLEDDYQKIGIDSKFISPKEDGMRTHGGPGSYEWWYCDSEYSDGTKIVVVFYSKNHFDVDGAACPTVNISITQPDKTKTGGEYSLKSGTVINASRDKCDVKIGASYLLEEGGNYILHYEDEQICYHAQMKSLLPMWRPDTGEIFFGNNGEHFFAWFVGQPSSQNIASLKIGDKTLQLEGTGYHDHNWGNIGMQKLMNHWYWGRAKVGDYNVIACDIIAGKKYGYKRFPIFFLAKDGKIISSNQSITKVQRADTIPHPITGKFMDNKLIYTQPIADGEFYTVEFARKRDIACGTLLDGFSERKIKLLKMIGINPTYARVLGDVTITHNKDGKKTVIKQDGLWEQMFFGGNKTAITMD